MPGGLSSGSADLVRGMLGVVQVVQCTEGVAGDPHGAEQEREATTRPIQESWPNPDDLVGADESRPRACNPAGAEGRYEQESDQEDGHASRGQAGDKSDADQAHRATQALEEAQQRPTEVPEGELRRCRRFLLRLLPGGRILDATASGTAGAPGVLGPTVMPLSLAGGAGGAIVLAFAMAAGVVSNAALIAGKTEGEPESGLQPAASCMTNLAAVLQGGMCLGVAAAGPQRCRAVALLDVLSFEHQEVQANDTHRGPDDVVPAMLPSLGVETGHLLQEREESSDGDHANAMPQAPSRAKPEGLPRRRGSAQGQQGAQVVRADDVQDAICHAVQHGGGLRRPSGRSDAMAQRRQLHHVARPSLARGQGRTAAHIPKAGYEKGK
mmetsp:Transcript_119904/g.344509  ORF Transcript_119904/g.344509 Transcript_119904/m.344509 type:complete len:382 (-) Transcript_119904:22-1167(-)